MPTYEYECDACRHRFEQFQSITAEALRKCPKCGKQKLRRLIGIGGAVIFKGGGFYETDYRSEGYRKAEEAERKSGEAKPEAKSDGDTTKPKADAATKTDAPKPAKKEAAPSETPSPAKPAPAAKPVGKAKSHAREGRGVGNLKRSATKPAAKKSTRRGR